MAKGKGDKGEDLVKKTFEQFFGKEEEVFKYRIWVPDSKIAKDPTSLAFWITHGINQKEKWAKELIKHEELRNIVLYNAFKGHYKAVPNKEGGGWDVMIDLHLFEK